MSAPAGAVDVAHSRALGVGGNRGIMRKSTISSGHGLAPMCADPSHRTWEPDRHTQLSPENPVIPTKNSYIPVEAPVSHVQHRRQPHLPNTASDARLQRTSGDLPSPGEVLANTAADALTPRTPRRDQSKDRSRAGVRPISSRSATDLEPECDRSRRGSGPISSRSTTDLGEGGRAKGAERRGAGRLTWGEVSAQPSLCGDEDQRSQQHEQTQGERRGLLEDLRVLPGRLDRRGDDGEVLRRDDLAQAAAGQVLTTHDREEAGADPTATAPRLHDIAEGGDGHMRVSPGRVLAKEKEQPKKPVE